MRKQHKRLRLSKESVRALQPKEPAPAGGFTTGPTDIRETCPDTAWRTCWCTNPGATCPSGTDCTVCYYCRI